MHELKDKQSIPNKNVSDINAGEAPNYHISPDIFNSEGLILHEQGEYHQAITKFKAAIALDNKQTYYYYNLGLAQFEINELNEAVNSFTEALNLDSSDSQIYCYRGLAYHVLFQYEKALSDYTEALHLDNDTAEYYYCRGITNYCLNRLNDALNDCVEATHLDPQIATYLNLLGTIYIALSKYQAAIDCFNSAKAKDPLNITLNKNLAIAFILQNKLTLARQMIQQVLDGKNNNVHDNLIISYGKIIYSCIDWLENDLELPFAQDTLFEEIYEALPNYTKAYVLCEILARIFFQVSEKFSYESKSDDVAEYNLVKQPVNKLKQNKLHLAYQQLSVKLEQLIKIMPQHVSLYYFYGKLLLWLDNHEQAHANFNQCTQRHPQFLLNQIVNNLISQEKKSKIRNSDIGTNQLRVNTNSNSDNSSSVLEDQIINFKKFNTVNFPIDCFPINIREKLKIVQNSSSFEEAVENFVVLMTASAYYLSCEGQITQEPSDFKVNNYFELFSKLLNYLDAAWHRAVKEHVNCKHKDDKEYLFQNLQDWFYAITQPEPDNEPAKDLFIHKFEQHANAKENAKHTALIFNGAKLSYKQLNEKANQLASALILFKIQNKLSDESRVALLFENSPEAVISILAVMKAGLAYVPITLDNKISYERLVYYITASDAKLFITKDILHHQNNNFIHFIKHNIPLLPIRYFDIFIAEGQSINNPDCSIKRDQLAYCIFSSGTSGPPKGIAITHKGLLNPVIDITNKFKIDKSDRIGGHSILTFDASLLDIMTALSNAATFVIIPQDIRTDIEKLTNYCNEYRINLMTLVPSVLQQLEPQNFPFLRGYISTGEPGNERMFQRWHKTGLSDNSMPRIGINGYGPSEVTVSSLNGIYEVGKPLHIGTEPVPGLKRIVMKKSDDNQQYPFNPEKVQIGEIGELYLAGDGLARGYLKSYNYKNNYDRRFRTIIEPEFKNSYRLIRIYQTGDEVLEDKDKKIYFKGRIGDKNKILGELVQPSAIENAIAEFKINQLEIFSNIKVIIKQPQKDVENISSYLEVYLLAKIDITEEIIRELHFFLSHHPYCNIVPSHYRVMKEWPVSAHGKSIETSLPNDFLKTLFSCHPFRLMPTNNIAVAIREIWYEILSIDPSEYEIGYDDNFFELGGKSIHATNMLSLVQERVKEFPKKLSLFYSCPTIRSLSYQVENVHTDSIHSLTWQYGKNTFEKAQKNIQYPVILINSVTGDSSEDFNLLIKHWESIMKGWPLISTKILSLSNAGYHVDSITHLALDYIKTIKQDNILKEYNGPIILMGFSAGGVIAYEMARLLQEENIPTSVCCIDTLCPIYYQTLSQDAYAHEIEGLMNNMLKVMGIDTKDIPIKDFKKYSKLEQLTYYARRLAENMRKVSESNMERYLKYLSTLDNIITTQFYYEPKPIEDMTLISFSNTASKNNANKQLCWPDEIPLTNIPIQGEHSDFVKEDKSKWVEHEIMPKIKQFCELSQKKLCATPVKSMYHLNNEIKYIDKQSKLLFADHYISAQIQKHTTYSYRFQNSGKSQTIGLALHGMFSNENTINVNNLFQNGIDGHKVLIDGLTGVGKTTFLKYVRYLSTLSSIDTNKPKWLKKFAVAFYVPLDALKQFKNSKNDFNSKKELAKFLWFVFQKEFQEFPKQFSMESILDILNSLDSQHILWLLDGCQGAITSLDKKEDKASIALTNKLLDQKNVIFVESSDHVDDLIAAFTDIKWNAHYKIHEFHLTDTQSYIRNYLNISSNIENEKLILTIIDKFPSLKLFILNPAMLKMTLYYLNSTTKENKSLNGIILNVVEHLIQLLSVDSRKLFRSLAVLAAHKKSNDINTNFINEYCKKHNIFPKEISKLLESLYKAGLVYKNNNASSGSKEDIFYKFPSLFFNYFLAKECFDKITINNLSSLDVDNELKNIIDIYFNFKNSEMINFLIELLSCQSESLNNFCTYLIRKDNVMHLDDKCLFLIHCFDNIEASINNNPQPEVIKNFICYFNMCVNYENNNLVSCLSNYPSIFKIIINDEQYYKDIIDNIMPHKHEKHIQIFCAELSHNSNELFMKLSIILAKNGIKLNDADDRSEFSMQQNINANTKADIAQTQLKR